MDLELRVKMEFENRVELLDLKFEIRMKGGRNLDGIWNLELGVKSGIQDGIGSEIWNPEMELDSRIQDGS